MSKPSAPLPVKFICSIISHEIDLFDKVMSSLSSRIDIIEHTSDIFLFDHTKYYYKEMGNPLWRRLIRFKNLVDASEIVNFKLITNKIEEEFAQNSSRLVNIDPGILSAERLVLATGKNFSHRIYLGKGIFADLTLLFKKDSFQPLEWSFPDYSSPPILPLLNDWRNDYMKQLKEMRQKDANEHDGI